MRRLIILITAITLMLSSCTGHRVYVVSDADADIFKICVTSTGDQ